jgi:2,3,4,5-tetrahydropyridine-2-carboxylate N-succinyltransferase
MSDKIFALGLGIGSSNKSGDLLEVYFPQPVIAPSAATVAALQTAIGYSGGQQVIDLNPSQLKLLESELRSAGDSTQADIVKAFKTSDQKLVAVVLAADEAPGSVAEAYLKLHLLSHRLAKPHDIDLGGVFAVLPNVAWTNEGAIDLAELPQRQLQARLKGQPLAVNCVDKFPRMTDYVVPEGVRIAHTARVRLGAYLGSGTTIMHEGFVNFNAGTEGPGMIEGRISAGVFVGKGSDLGGGCSTMGTLSGGGNIIISIGEDCLVGANAGVGIPLGDRCKIESGLYVTAGTIVTVIDDTGAVADQVKARDLAGQPDLLFRRNSKNGAVECLTHKSAIELNHALHAHN